MSRLLMTAAGCVLLAGAPAAWAQSPPEGGTNPAEREYPRGDWRGSGGWDGGGREDGGGWHGHHERGGPGGFRGGAQFWLRSGDTRLGVSCDPNEPIRACVDA